jgi:hypothetical protein
VSYDLMVFEPEAAPKDHDAFMEWCVNLTKWNDGRYDDPARTSARLRAWVQEMRRMFPDMNTPEAEIHLQDDDSVLADYTIGVLSPICLIGFISANVRVTLESSRH